MTEYICTCGAICVEQKREQPAKPQVTSIWNTLRNLVETVYEIYRCDRDAQPNFSNGGVRIIVRPDRIDLA